MSSQLLCCLPICHLPYTLKSLDSASGCTLLKDSNWPSRGKGPLLSLLLPLPVQDWQLNLLKRAAELAPGGQLIIVNFCISPDKHWLGHSDVGPCMYGTMMRLWAQMRDEGHITKVCGPDRAGLLCMCVSHADLPRAHSGLGT